MRPEQIRRRDDHGRRRDHREERLRAEGADEHEELADESVRPRHADAAQRDDREQRREHRHHARDAAVDVDQARVPALVDHADEEEQRAGRDAVVDHDHQRALHALHGEREDAEHHEAEVADRRVGDELLEVRLHQRRRARRTRCRSPRARGWPIGSPGLIAAAGKSGTASRRKPKVPSLSMMLARTTEPAVGASTCASGSQVWNGNIGTFTANARKKAPNSHFAAVGVMAACVQDVVVVEARRCRSPGCGWRARGTGSRRASAASRSSCR